MPVFWLSFCDPDKPKESQFLGVALVEAASFETAHLAAWETGCNPGGEIAIEELSPEEAELNIVRANMNRLMSADELRQLDFLDSDDQE